MRARQAFLSAPLLLVVSAAGCTTTTTVNGGGSGCTADSSVGHCFSSTGYSCPAGASPEQDNAALYCSDGVSSGGVTLYCCADVTFQPNTCARDATQANCAGASIGFSCAGSTRPDVADTSLICSSPTQGAGGAMLYCCDTASATPVTSCGPSTAVPCTTSGATGYLCPPGTAPPASVNCGAGVAEGNGNVAYCCNAGGATSAACTANTAVPCTTAGATGYSCSGGATPPAPLSCGQGTGEPDGTMGYCCTTATATATCAANTAVPCTTAGATGYSCSGGATPAASLSCGQGTGEPDGTMGYCCAPLAATTTTCAPSTAIACGSGGAGYTCSGTDAPWQATRTLICENITTNGVAGYCCYSSANSCVQAPTLSDCSMVGGGAFGVACSGGDTTPAANSGLLCGADPGGAAGAFCCTTSSTSSP